MGRLLFFAGFLFIHMLVNVCLRVPPRIDYFRFFSAASRASAMQSAHAGPTELVSS